MGWKTKTLKALALGATVYLGANVVYNGLRHTEDYQSPVEFLSPFETKNWHPLPVNFKPLLRDIDKYCIEGLCFGYEPKPGGRHTVPVLSIHEKSDMPFYPEQISPDGRILSALYTCSRSLPGERYTQCMNGEEHLPPLAQPVLSRLNLEQRTTTHPEPTPASGVAADDFKQE